LRTDKKPFIKIWGPFAQIGMLEYWKNGKMGFGKEAQGVMTKFILAKKSEIRQDPSRKPIFHHSNIPLFHIYETRCRLGEILYFQFVTEILIR